MPVLTLSFVAVLAALARWNQLGQGAASQRDGAAVVSAAEIAWYSDPVTLALAVIAVFVIVDLALMVRQFRSHARRTHLVT